MKQEKEETDGVTWAPFGQHSDSEPVGYVIIRPAPGPARSVNDKAAHAALASKLVQLDAAFGADLAALWTRLVADVRALGTDPDVVYAEGHAALMGVCEKGSYFFAEILARNGCSDVLERALQYARAQHAPPACAEIEPDPRRN